MDRRCIRRVTLPRRQRAPYLSHLPMVHVFAARASRSLRGFRSDVSLTPVAGSMFLILFSQASARSPYASIVSAATSTSGGATLLMLHFKGYHRSHSSDRP